jgi:hypothetical protein
MDDLEQRPDWDLENDALRREIERLRAALQDAKDLALGDAPPHMIVDVCDRALGTVVVGGA